MHQASPSNIPPGPPVLGINRDSAPDYTADEIPDICICNKCYAKACVGCERPWHEGESCAAYQARNKDRWEEEDKSRESIDKLTKPCPSCKTAIQKAGGCKHMYCSNCSHAFNWT